MATAATNAPTVDVYVIVVQEPTQLINLDNAQAALDAMESE